MIASRPEPSIRTPSSDRFADQALELCQELERWRAEKKLPMQASTEGFPAIVRKACCQSLVFFIAFLISANGFRYVQEAHNAAASLAMVLVMTISMPSAPILFLFQAVGVGKAQFWRAVVSWRKGPSENYPFTSLISGLESDSAQSMRLRKFRTGVLKTVLERIGQEETELRERLSVFIGSPTALVLFGVGGGAITAWESYHARPDSMGHAALFYGSIATLLLGACGFRLRLALFEFSRCRGLLSLEIARRGESSQRH